MTCPWETPPRYEQQQGGVTSLERTPKLHGVGVPGDSKTSSHSHWSQRKGLGYPLGREFARLSLEGHSPSLSPWVLSPEGHLRVRRRPGP